MANSAAGRKADLPFAHVSECLSAVIIVTHLLGVLGGVLLSVFLSRCYRLCMLNVFHVGVSDNTGR